ncbi:MAG: hypothetical protein Devi2KO_37140 [Devosia indica]
MIRVLVSAVAFTLSASAIAQDARTVVDALDRTIVIPTQVERITILDPLAALEAALSMGIVPTQIGQRSFVAEYLGDPLLQWPWLEQALVELGADPLRMNADETDLEVVALGEPDLILGGDWWVESAEEQLTVLAPTVAVPIVDVRSTIELYGDVFGMQERAREVIENWDSRIESELRLLTPASATLALIRTDEAGTITIFNASGHGAYDYFQQAGYTTPPEILDLPVNIGGYASGVSLERIDLLASADVIVVLGFSVEETEQLLADPIFLTLPAVSEGRVVTIGQGPVAQATAVQSPLNFDILLEMAKEVAAAAAKAN